LTSFGQNSPAFYLHAPIVVLHFLGESADASWWNFSGLKQGFSYRGACPIPPRVPPFPHLDFLFCPDQTFLPCPGFSDYTIPPSREICHKRAPRRRNSDSGSWFFANWLPRIVPRTFAPIFLVAALSPNYPRLDPRLCGVSDPFFFFSSCSLAALLWDGNSSIRVSFFLEQPLLPLPPYAR